MKKKNVVVGLGIVLVCLIFMVIFLTIKNKSERISDNQEKTRRQIDLEDSILERITYDYPIMTSMILYKDGKVKEGRMVDELNIDGTLPEPNYEELKILNKDDVQKIINQINKMKSNMALEYSHNYYGISINVDGNMKAVDCYNQSDIDKLNDLINELIYK